MKNSNVNFEEICDGCQKDATEIIWKFLSPLCNILLNAFARKENAIHQRTLAEKKHCKKVKTTHKLISRDLFETNDVEMSQPEAAMDVDEVASQFEPLQSQPLSQNLKQNRKLQIFKSSR